ncbi:Uncharacterised protein [Legionella pneumophila]|nr:Uncharacterised protein [Legionella pneumophila]CZK25542.1 Uncharacterised protein [Legionella pneumophila]
MKENLIKKIVQKKLLKKNRGWCGPGTCIG